MPEVSMFQVEQLLLSIGQWQLFLREIADDLPLDLAQWADEWSRYDRERGAIHDAYRSYQRMAHYSAWFQAKAEGEVKRTA